jgi:gas vesicle protein
MRDDDDMPYIVVERRNGGFGAFVFGALVGAGVALLFAPRSGRELRDDIADGARRIRDTAEGKVRDVQSAVNDTIESVRRQVSDRVDAARDAIDAGRAAARESRADMERRIRETRAGYETARQAYEFDEDLEEDLDLEGGEGS